MSIIGMHIYRIVLVIRPHQIKSVSATSPRLDQKLGMKFMANTRPIHRNPTMTGVIMPQMGQIEITNLPMTQK